MLSNVSSLPFQTIVFCAGWMVKNLHSAFDYIFNSVKKDDDCAHVLAGWMNQADNKFQGGYSPRFEAIKTDPDQALLFLKALFFNQRHNVEENILKLLFASILRFYNDFEALLSLEPNNKFDGKC